MPLQSSWLLTISEHAAEDDHTAQSTAPLAVAHSCHSEHSRSCHGQVLAPAASSWLCAELLGKRSYCQTQGAASTFLAHLDRTGDQSAAPATKVLLFWHPSPCGASCVWRTARGVWPGLAGLDPLTKCTFWSAVSCGDQAALPPSLQPGMLFTVLFCILHACDVTLLAD